MNRLYIRRASELASCSGRTQKRGKEMADIGLIHDGAVLMEDGRITAVGETGQLDRMLGLSEEESHALDRKETEETAWGGRPLSVINAFRKTLLPGFVDSHTHFIFGGYRADEFSWRLKGDSYMSIMERGGGINATIEPTRTASEEELITAGMDRLNRMAEFGVTTV